MAKVKIGNILNCIFNRGALSTIWSSTAAYTAGQYVAYGNYFYKCIKNTAAGTVPTNTTYWEKTNLASEITTLNSNLAKADAIEETTLSGDDSDIRIVRRGNIASFRTVTPFNNKSTSIEYNLPSAVSTGIHDRQICTVMNYTTGIPCGGAWIYESKIGIFKDSSQFFTIAGSYIIC